MVQQTHAQQVEEALNLKRQLNILDTIADSDMIFQDTSPPKRWDIVYSTQSGEPIRVARHRLIATLEKRLPNGERAFTADRDKAPVYRLGTVKCFLAKGSEEREMIDRLNISPGYYCPAEHLANDGAARIHAEKRHPSRWRIYQEHIYAEERKEEREERRQQTGAMLRLAGSRAEQSIDEGADGEEPAVRRRGRPPRSE